jgi:hypothetical protein
MLVLVPGILRWSTGASHLARIPIGTHSGRLLLGTDVHLLEKTEELSVFVPFSDPAHHVVNDLRIQLAAWTAEATQGLPQFLELGAAVSVLPRQSHHIQGTSRRDSPRDHAGGGKHRSAGVFQRVLVCRRDPQEGF